MEPPPPPHPDETRLDMNPLIDVALVLLIFFILTATYTTLRRAIELPPEPTDDKGRQAAQVVKNEDIKDRVFKVKVRMEDGQAGHQDRGPGGAARRHRREMQEFVRTHRAEGAVRWTSPPDVPWGIEAAIYDAAKGADIHQI